MNRTFEDIICETLSFFCVSAVLCTLIFLSGCAAYTKPEIQSAFQQRDEALKVIIDAINVHQSDIVAIKKKLKMPIPTPVPTKGAETK